MSFLKKIFIKAKKNRVRHVLNAPGDFYVEQEGCTLCGSPEFEAHGLMGRSDEGCYFIRQPQTKEEIEYAINSVAVSCISIVRYAGTDQRIIKKLHDLGSGDECDNPLILK